MMVTDHNYEVMHIQKSVYLLKDSSLQRLHLHLLLPQAGVERNSLCVSLGTNLRYVLISSVLKVVKERRILNEEMCILKLTTKIKFYLFSFSSACTLSV